jgi:gliding motility-associated-like protein
MKRILTLLAFLFLSAGISAQDLSVIAIPAPVSGCGLTSTQAVTIRIFNYGPNLPAGSSFNVSYTINAGVPVVELLTLSSNMLTNSTLNYTFTTTANLSVPGIYEFDATVSIAGDINPTNNAFDDYFVTSTGPSVGGTISGPSSVCISGNSGLLTLTGNTGSILRWEVSTDGGSSWVTLSNTTANQPYNNISVPTQYRAVVQNGGCTPVNSSIIAIAIDPASVGGSVAGSASVCATGNSGTLTLNGRVGNILQWEFSTDGGVTWTVIANTTNTQSYNNLTQSTLYRARVQSGTCNAVYSSAGSIAVSQPAVGGDLSPIAVTECSGTNSGILTLASQSGTINRWEFSINNGITWTNVTNTTSSLAYSNLTQTRWYRVRVLSGTCPQAYSDTAIITVNGTSVGGVITPSSTTVCGGTNSGTLTLSGHTGAVNMWEFSIDGGLTWTTIANTTTTQTFTNLTTTTIYRALVQNAPCVAVVSATATVTVNPASNGGTISGGTTVCSGSNSGNLILSGQIGSVTHWEFSNDGITWNNIANTTTTQNYSALTDTTYYRAIVTNGVCPSDTSTLDSVVVDPVSVGGTLAPATLLLCSGNNSGTITLSGQTGNVIRWEYSTDNGSSWISISNTATTQSYTNIPTSTIYRALVQSGVCSTVYSSSTLITVDQPSVGGTLYGSSTVCSGSNSGVLTLVGAVGVISNWESSSDGGITWTPIANTTTSNNFLNLTDTTLYRVLVTNGVCPSDTSTLVTILVDEPSVGGFVTLDDTVCSGANSGTLTLSGHTGVVNSWEFSTDGGITWLSISNNTTSQGYFNLTQTTRYRATVKNGVCNPIPSSVAIITVDVPATGGSIAGSTTVCSTANSGALNLVGSSGTLVSWETSTDGGLTWTPNGNTTTTENYTNLTDTTWYRAIVTSGTCGNDTSLVGMITVDPATVGGILASNDTVCSGLNGDTIRLSGYTGTVLRWEYSFDGGNNWIAVSNNSDSLIYSNLTITTLYRAVVQSGTCVSLYSSVDTITVTPATVAGVISGATSTCEGTGNGTLTLNNQVGNVIDWESSTDGGLTWVSLGNTTTSQAWSNLSDTTWYRAIVGGSCVSDTTAPVTIIVHPKPVAAFSVADVCQGIASVFVNTTTVGSGNIQFQTWDFGDNDASVTGNPTHNYATAGLYSVSLIVVTNQSCADTATGTALVNALPNTSITVAGNTILCLGDSVALSVGANINYTYLWNTGDTLNTTQANASAFYTITITDTTTGCMAMDSVEITVAPGVPVNAGPDTTISAGTSIMLQGTGSGNLVWSPSIGLSDPFIANPIATPPYSIVYVLSSNDPGGCTSTDSVTVTLRNDFNVIVSNMITANGDGHNDTWVIQHIEYYPDNKVTVYNRNGMVVFEADDYLNGWTGTYNGDQLPDGTYYYVIQITGSEEVIQGAVTIISENK